MAAAGVCLTDHTLVLHPFDKLAGAGGTLNGRLLLMDARIPEWRSVRVNRDPACKVCSPGFPSR